MKLSPQRTMHVQIWKSLLLKFDNQSFFISHNKWVTVADEKSYVSRCKSNAFHHRKNALLSVWSRNHASCLLHSRTVNDSDLTDSAFLQLTNKSFVTTSKRFQTIKEGITYSDASLLSYSHCNKVSTVSAIYLRCFLIVLILLCYVGRDSEFLSESDNFCNSFLFFLSSTFSVYLCLPFPFLVLSFDHCCVSIVMIWILVSVSAREKTQKEDFFIDIFLSFFSQPSRLIIPLQLLIGS